jgi:predicted phosphoribosyltransferase
MATRFLDRRDAGRQLADRLRAYADRPDVLVLALPRGGVPVAYEVAHALHAPLDVVLVRKLGVPGHEELAMGAVASGGIRVLDPDVIRVAHVTSAELEIVTEAEQRELDRRATEYRGDQPFPTIRGRTVILVDDGLATGATMRAAIMALRQEHPARLVVAAPVAPPQTCDDLRTIAEDVVCAVTPDPFYAVGLWYEDFGQTTDAEVRELLEARSPGSRIPNPESRPQESK